MLRQSGEHVLADRLEAETSRSARTGDTRLPQSEAPTLLGFAELLMAQRALLKARMPETLEGLLEPG